MFEQLNLLVTFVFGYVLSGLSSAIGGNKLLILLCCMWLLSQVVNLILTLKSDEGGKE